MNYKKNILDELLNKYEKSKSFNGASNRRIILNTNKKIGYDIENSEEKNIFHDTVFELKQKQLIDYDWKEYEKGNILNSIWLNKQNVEKAYLEINRSNKKDETTQILEELETYNFSDKQWLEEFKKDIMGYCQKTRKPNILLPYKYHKDILKALYNLQPEKETLKRVFSIQCFGDSKYFENEIKNYIIRIVKKYSKIQELTVGLEKELSQDLLEELSNEEILAQVGIVKSPEIIEFCGELEAKIDGEIIEYNTYTQGNYINSYTIRKMENIQISNTSKIIFIENKANYLEYIKNEQQQGEFVIYHGGMYSETKGIFFKKIYDSIINKNNAENKVEFYHWSDIDIGGFRIFTRLKNEIIPELKPYKMRIEDLKIMQKYWKSISKEYQKELEKMHEMQEYREFRDTIEFMIKNRCKLEQECFIRY